MKTADSSMQSAADYDLLDTNGIRLAVHRQGDGAPVVLCHGWPEIAYSWRHQVAALSQAGYQVIAPNQRGYWLSDKPAAVADYDITHLCGDLVGLLDHYGHEQAVFAGHDWGAIVVWNLAMLHPERVAGVINLSVPFMERGPTDWVSFWESRLGGDFYIVHFNRQPGVADGIFESNTPRFLRNIYRAGQWNTPREPRPGMALANLATDENPAGELILSEDELSVFVNAFETSGFTGGLNWYRNFTRNWELTAHVTQRIDHPSLMIYGDFDSVPKFEALNQFVPNVEVHSLACGHWIQQERPEETSALMLEWLQRNYPA